MTTVKNVGALTDLADGSILAPGETKDVTAKSLGDPFNQQLIEEGRIMVVSEEPKSKKGGDK
jgi:hypothetical protein